MSGNFGIGNNFDKAWKEAKQQLVSQGNNTPTTQDILHYLVDKWRPQQDTTQIQVQGLHIEHDSTPVMKYGANIGCSNVSEQEPQLTMKYGANINCNPDIEQNQELVMKYGANINCNPGLEQQPQMVMKYGANIGCNPISNQDTAPVMKYGANIGCNPVPEQNQQIHLKYGVNVGCDNKFKVKTEFIEKLSQHKLDSLSDIKVTIDRANQILKAVRKNQSKEY